MFGKDRTFPELFSMLLDYHNGFKYMTSTKGDLILPNILAVAGIIITILTMVLEKSGAWLAVGLLLVLLGIGVYFITRE